MVPGLHCLGIAMTMYRITDLRSGQDYGLFSATSETDALDMVARAHGSANYRSSTFCTPAYKGQLRCTPLTVPLPSEPRPSLMATIGALIFRVNSQPTRSQRAR